VTNSTCCLSLWCITFWGGCKLEWKWTKWVGPNSIIFLDRTPTFEWWVNNYIFEHGRIERHVIKIYWTMCSKFVDCSRFNIGLRPGSDKYLDKAWSNNDTPAILSSHKNASTSPTVVCAIQFIKHGFRCADNLNQP
jgi:hypothetical protein